MRPVFMLASIPVAVAPKRRSEALKRRLLVSLVLAMMLSATVAGPASATPSGYNYGNHYGDIAHEDSGMHIGHGAGLGKYENLGLNPERRGLR
jgi:hypothetical protein